MTHWTSIPFYLWKNTFKRWLENPFPALVKILIPALLAALGVVALAMFSQIERELKLQLQRSSALKVQVSEYVSSENAASMTFRTEADELMWSNRVGSDNLRFATQLLTSARMEGSATARSIPVFSKPSYTSREADQLDQQNPPVVELLHRRKTHHGTSIISLGGMKLQAMTQVMPQWVEELSSSNQAVLIPEDMAHPLKRGGYMHHMVAELGSIDEVERFVTELKAYVRADDRQVTVTSAVDILEQLQRIQGIQDIVRRLLVAGCCLILALTLGSIAWLEYRQDSYLLALLRSFGTPSWILFLHALVENLLLVMLGILSVLLCWKLLYKLIVENISVVGFEVPGAPTLPAQDVLLIVFGGLLGVLFAMAPIAVGLRKPTGHTLQ